MRWPLLFILILLAALALQAGLLVFAMYALLGVVLLSRFWRNNGFRVCMRHAK